jgi:hypothetical protein
MQPFPQPNNLGPALLLGLAQIRTLEGRPALPLLARNQHRLWRVLRGSFPVAVP